VGLARAVGYDGGMDENPYKAPREHFTEEIRRKRRRRKQINFILTVALFVGLFVAFWGLKLIYQVVGGWIMRH
jgi:hypothetical protein